LARRVENADAVGESTMRCAGKNKLRESELSNSSKPLEFLGLQQRPSHLLEVITAELD
jgi:hypothetical protein